MDIYGAYSFYRQWQTGSTSHEICHVTQDTSCKTGESVSAGLQKQTQLTTQIMSPASCERVRALSAFPRAAQCADMPSPYGAIRQEECAHLPNYTTHSRTSPSSEVWPSAAHKPQVILLLQKASNTKSPQNAIELYNKNNTFH